MAPSPIQEITPMGLDCTHDAFHGSYSSFNRLRKVVARAAGGAYPDFDAEDIAYLKSQGTDTIPDPTAWYWDDKRSKENSPGLHEFFCHSDCDGDISPEKCRLVADELEQLLPAVEAAGEGQGHILRDGGYGAVLRRFIAGCRKAHVAGEPLVFC